MGVVKEVIGEKGQILGWDFELQDLPPSSLSSYQLKHNYSDDLKFKAKKKKLVVKYEEKRGEKEIIMKLYKGSFSFYMPPFPCYKIG